MKQFKYLTLAAFVAFAACDEGTETPVTPPTTGSISGVVTIEGTGQAGVTVTLSSGTSATTDATGSYSFTGVNAGSYTVTISGFPADATFPSTSAAATITTAGQVVQVNFAGSFVRTSAILGNVSAGGAGLQGVNVSIGGGVSTTTDANGQYAFSGLRAGSYTVSISGFDSSLYSFASTSQSVTLGVGESQIVSFSGMLQSTASIRGSLFIDENAKNDVFDSVEDKLAVAGVTITLEGGGVGNTISTETDANGDYMFTDLVGGTYRVAIDAADADIPDYVELGDADEQLVTIVTGAVGTANWPFDIIVQTVRVGAFLGRDTTPAMIAPIKDVEIKLYPTEDDLTAGTNVLGTEDTGADGYAVFEFDRADDTAPAGGQDQIVFARVSAPPAGPYFPNGEINIEIQYDARSADFTGADVFDFLYNQVVIRFEGDEIDGDSLSQWRYSYRQNDTTVAGGGLFSLAGVVHRTITGTNIPTGGVDRAFVRIARVQTLGQDGGHAWEQTLTGDAASNVGSYLRYTWDGTVLPGDTINMGLAHVKYLDSDVRLREHHEADDSLGLTLGDNFQGSPSVSVAIVDIDGDTVKLPKFFPNTDGIVKFFGVKTETPYTALAKKGAAHSFLTGNSVAFTLDGSDQEVDLFGDESTFVHKFNNTQITGWVRAADGTNWTVATDSVMVRIQAAPNNIGSTTDTTVLTNGSASGSFMTNANLLEGPYIITAMEKAGKWAYFDTLTAAPPLSSGGADNDDEDTAMRDLQGNGAVAIARFWAKYMDASVEGRVINDRDNDNNVIDPGEALAGAQIELVYDKAVVGTATTDANGEYMFEGLKEGTYMVRWVDDTPDATVTVLKALATDSAFVTMTAVAPDAGGTIAALPRWNYDTSAGDGDDDVADFMFLYKNTVARAIVQTAGGTKIQGMTVALRRCDDSTGAVSPPQTAVAQTCTTYLGSTVTTLSDSGGVATFSNLVEGVYQITPQPGTVGSYTTSAPTSTLYITLGSADVESATFIIS